MAADAWQLYSEGRVSLGQRGMATSTDTYRMALFTSSYTPNIADTNYSTLSGEVVNGNGYTTGGIVLTNDTVTVEGTGFKFSSDNAVFTASGGTITGVRYAVIYNETSAGNTLIGYCLLDNAPADLPDITDTNTLTISPPSTGWFTGGV